MSTEPTQPTDPSEGTLSFYDYGDPIHLGMTAELDMVARILDETASASIHNETAMRHAAIALRYRLRNLAAAVKAERGETR
ncbi:hypothetical protein ACKI16_24325 [Streptomyces scabiei]|uniref:hypothetical protein n=1 Tax=Streptomyces scabiei TaxID=1930 RepID=UPI0038F7FD77